METLQNYIDDAFVPPEGGAYLDDVNPATGAVYAQIPDAGEADIDRAVAAAERAFPAWSDTPAQDRARVLLRLSDLIEANLDRLAHDESTDNGKPVALARTVDIPRAALNFRFFATAILHTASEAHDMGPTGLNYTLRRPLGVVGCISPWNLPLYLFSWKIAPALAAGNCVVGKPSEVTPMTAYRLCALAREAGLPPGVLNVIHGTGPRAGAALTAHPRIAAISFTGGTRTGAAIARTAAPQFKKLSLELGGKNPVIIFDDCRYDEMLATTVRSAFSNQGEICLCGSRIFVQRSLYDRFRDDFVARVRALRVGDPAEAQSDLGAVVSAAHMEKILSYIALARDEGGRVLCGGERVYLPGRCRDGFFVAPTVIEGLPAGCRTNQEEIFGPVATLIPFDTEEEALDGANGTPYGLAAILWTEHLTRAHRMAARLQAGIVWVNCWMLRDLRTPFGGMKQSGMGREGGWEALRFFTEPRNVCLKLG